jgi:hypothetical protein
MRTQPAKLGPPVPEPVAAELEHKEPQHGPLRMSLWRQAPGRGEALVISRHEANAGASARSWTERPSWSFRDAATICARECVIGGQEPLAHV